MCLPFGHSWTQISTDRQRSSHFVPMDYAIQFGLNRQGKLVYGVVWLRQHCNLDISTLNIIQFAAIRKHGRFWCLACWKVAMRSAKYNVISPQRHQTKQKLICGSFMGGATGLVGLSRCSLLQSDFKLMGSSSDEQLGLQLRQCVSSCFACTSKSLFVTAKILETELH